MTRPVDLGQSLELRDPSGSTLGFYVPAREYETRFGSNGTRFQELEAERQRLEQLCKEVTAERDALRAEMADLRRERDQYLRSLYELIPRTPFTFTEEELAEMEKNGVTFDQILADLEELKGS